MLTISGKIAALKAAKMYQPEAVYNTPLEEVAAPFLEGDALVKYLAATNGIKGMTARGLSAETIQGVLARCMIEKENKSDFMVYQCIDSYVEIFKADVAMTRTGPVDFILDMGYGHLFQTKWTPETPQLAYHKAIFNMMMESPDHYVPKLSGWDPISVSCFAEHSKYNLAKKTLATTPPPLSPQQTTEEPLTDDEDKENKDPFDVSRLFSGNSSENLNESATSSILFSNQGRSPKYFIGLTHLLICLRSGRFQEGLAYGFDLLSKVPKTGGHRALDLYTMAAECCGALFCHEPTRVLLQKASEKAKTCYERAQIASVAQSVFRHWGCYEEENQLFKESSLDDKNSWFYAQSLRHHLDATVDSILSILAVRACKMHYHKYCTLEKCKSDMENVECSYAFQNALDELKQHLHLAKKYLNKGNGEYYSAIHEVCEAADLALLLQDTDYTLVQTLLNIALNNANIAIAGLNGEGGNDPNTLPAKALIEVLNYITKPKAPKAKYMKKMALFTITMARRTGTRTSVLAGNVMFTHGVLISILGPFGSHNMSQKLFEKASDNYMKATMDRSYRVKLANIACHPNSCHRYIGRANKSIVKLSLTSAHGDRYSKAVASEFFNGGQTDYTFEDRSAMEEVVKNAENKWPEKMAWECLNLIGSIKYGQEAIRRRN